MNIQELQKQIEQRQLAVEWEQAKASGKPICAESRPITPEADWEQVCNPSWDFATFEYRRKSNPKIIPWTFSDITPEIAGAWFRPKGHFADSGAYCRMTSFGDSCGGFLVKVSGEWIADAIGWGYMFKNLEWSTDLKNWHPCGKVLS